MQSLVSAVLLGCALSAVAQTQAIDNPGRTPMPSPEAPPQGGHRIRRATPSGNSKSANVPPNTPVVTLKGVCAERQSKNDCETVITREDLDRYASASAPDSPQIAPSRQAIQYAGLLALSELAELQGLEKNPALVKEMALQVKLVRMRILASALLQNLQKQTAGILEPEIQKYYDEHRAQYELAQVRRLAVPFEVPTESGRPLDRSAAKSEMETIRSRAAAGDDLNLLLQDAYKNLHIQAVPPPLNIITLKRSTVLGDEAKAFDLNPGEVSPVLDLPAALAVMKLESKQQIPLASVHQDIEVVLRQQRTQEQLRQLGKKISAQFNLQYFDMASQPDIFGSLATVPPTRRDRVRGVPAANGTVETGP